MKWLTWLLATVAGPLFAQTVSTNHYDTLKQSRCFALSGGIANATTRENYALAAICAKTNATAIFQRLLLENGDTQKLYALLGLRLVDPMEFKTALPPLLQSKSKVLVLRGCIAGEREVSEVAREVQTKKWILRTVPVPGGKYAPEVVEQ